MIEVDRSARGGDAAAGARLLVTELLRRHDQVARVTEVPRIVVDVLAAQRQGCNVVDDSSEFDATFLEAVLAQAIRPAQSAEAQALACSATKPLTHGVG